MNMPVSWGVFVLVGAVLAVGVFVFFLYVREIDTCPRGLKICLAAIRFSVLFLLVMVLLGPALRYNQRRTIEPFVMLARDASQSMSTKDEYLDESAAESVAKALGISVEDVRRRKVSRAELMNELLKQDDYKFIKKLQSYGMVRVLDFSHEVRTVGTLAARYNVDVNPNAAADDDTDGDSPAAVVSPLEPFGRGTDFGAAINEAIGVNPLAAVIVFSDGQRTLGDELAKIGERLKKKGIKLFVVGVGDPRRSRNIRVKEVYVREKVWPNEPFEVDTVIDVEGEDIEQKQLSVQLYQDPGDGTPIQRQMVEVPKNGGLIRTKFGVMVPAAGKYKYKVVVQSIDRERKTDDNEEESGTIEAVERKAKVLLIAGAPTWEYRLVHRLLQRDETISLSCWLQTLDEERPQEGNEPINKLPTTKDELAKYHVIMMFDPNPDEFDDEWIRMLKDFAAKQSGGVLYMAGPKYAGSFLGGNRTGTLKDILPVRFGDVQRETLFAETSHQSDLQVVYENVDHPVMSFSKDPNRNLSHWENLPGIYWSFPSLGTKPTAKLLLKQTDAFLGLTDDNARPLLVTGRYGPANTVYIGFNGSWRWRRVGRQAEFFDKYWLQIVRYLIETRTLQNQRRGYVEPERDEYEVGEKIVLIAQLKDPAHDPLAVDEVNARLRSGSASGTALVFKKIENQPGQYEATITAREEGNYTVEIDLPGSEGTEATKVDTAFTVRLPSLETEQVWLNEASLREVAEKSGGQYFTINELDKLSASVPFLPENIEVKGRPELLWSLHQVPYRLMILLVLLLSVEWALRKGFRLL